MTTPSSRCTPSKRSAAIGRYQLSLRYVQALATAATRRAPNALSAVHIASKDSSCVRLIRHSPPSQSRRSLRRSGLFGEEELAAHEAPFLRFCQETIPARASK